IVHAPEDIFTRNTLPEVILRLRDKYLFYTISIDRLTGAKDCPAGRLLMNDLERDGWGDLIRDEPPPLALLFWKGRVQNGHSLKYLDSLVESAV
ncbi:MAG: hypothetical protein DRH24_18195, partial [Deltaproteobacteria bacterium]